MLKEFTQYLSPVGCGPSGKTCPKCALHARQVISVLIIPKERSSLRKILFSIDAKKLGHPEPDSNFVFELKRSSLQTMHKNVPFLYSLNSFPEKGGSVPQF